ncbi:MAG: hypothetical protein KDD94_15460, partial [Calditrichaeota bacterium]|nr:hypothetical protein [Calditrichota bacterium]
ENMTERQSIIEKLEMLNRKLKQSGKLSFHERKQLEQLLNRLKQLNQQLDQSKQSLSELSQKAEQENLFTDEMTSKFNEIKELLEKMNLMRPMEIKPSELNKMKDNEIQRDLANITEKEKEMQQQMDRLKSLLEKLKKEQEADFAIKKIQEFRDQQEKINQMPEQEKSRITQEQEKLADQVKQMEQKESSDAVFKKAQEKLAEKQIASRMEKSNKEKDAKEKREQLAKELDSLQKSLQEQMKKQQQEEKEELLAEIQDNQDKLLYLSFSQEDLATSAKTISVYSDQFRSIAYDQKLISQRIQFLINRLTNVAKQSFLFNPAIINVLQTAQQTSDNLIANLEQRQNQQAYSDQTSVISNLNQSILMLQNNKNNMDQANSALGSEEFQKQMEQMAQSQEAINGQTQSLWDMLRQQSGSGQSGQMGQQGRLKGQQGQGKG